MLVKKHLTEQNTPELFSGVCIFFIPLTHNPFTGKDQFKGKNQFKGKDQ